MTSARELVRRSLIVLTGCFLAVAALGPIDGARGAAQKELPLGPLGLEERRVTNRLALGVKHTMIERVIGRLTTSSPSMSF